MYCVVQTGSRMARFECGTTRSTLASPCASARGAASAAAVPSARARVLKRVRIAVISRSFSRNGKASRLRYPRRSPDLGRHLCHCLVEACEALIPGAQGEMQGVAEVHACLVPPQGVKKDIEG